MLYQEQIKKYIQNMHRHPKFPQLVSELHLQAHYVLQHFHSYWK